MKKEKITQETQSSKTFNKGFTLIEMLVVVLIIGILAAIALPQYQHTVDKARYAALMDITRAIADANERFYLVNDRYSTNFNQLDVDISANSVSGSIVSFDWGNCTFIGQQEIQCTNDTTLKNQYIIHYNQGVGSEQGGIFCTAQGVEENSRYDKVCQDVGTYRATYNGGCQHIGSCRVYYIRK